MKIDEFTLIILVLSVMVVLVASYEIFVLIPQGEQNKKDLATFNLLDCIHKKAYLLSAMNNGIISNYPYNTQLQLYNFECGK